MVCQNSDVIIRTTELEEAQQQLGFGSKWSRQAIIPMVDKEAGDPHTLPKEWDTGSMFWLAWWDINIMRDKCARSDPLCKGEEG